jgi:hypothetical protein
MNEEYCEEFRRRQEKGTRLIFGLVGVLLGFAIGAVNYKLNVKPRDEIYTTFRINLAAEAHTPKTAKIRDINGDGIEDLVVRSNLYDFILLGEKDGTFKFLEERSFYWESQEKKKLEEAENDNTRKTK